VSALMKFVPAQLPSSPQFRGLHVNLVVRGVNTSSLLPIGAPLTHAPLGSTVHVLIQVTSLDAVGQSTIRALMPGGLEPVDGNLNVDGELHFCCLLQCPISAACVSPISAACFNVSYPLCCLGVAALWARLC
jgi:hypothetical protein